MSDQPAVRRRRVFYIPGYDPFHPRRYRELYRKEAALQAAVSGHEIALRPGGRGARYGWHVDATIEGATCQTDFEVLVWSDLVRSSMNPGIVQTYLLLIRTAWIYIASGALWRLFRMRKGPVIAALYPVVFLLGQFLLALLAARLVGWGLSLVLPDWTAWAGLAAVPPILLWFKRHDNKVFAYYLMHDYAYAAAHRGANPPELEGRMAEFTATIRAALDEDLDEVLIVGHSSGAHLGVSILSDLLRGGALPADAPALSFLSLGQVVPMVSFLPRADRLRADLRFLSEQTQIPWVDVTAPGDGCAFALCDPVAVSGVATPAQRWPLVLSAAFTKSLSPARWKELRWRFFRLHFQYLCAFDRPRGYDYFAITAGGKNLGDRFADRLPTPSRIARPLSPYRSVAA